MKTGSGSCLTSKTATCSGRKRSRRSVYFFCLPESSHVFFLFSFPHELNNVQHDLNKRANSLDKATCGGKEKEQRRVSTSAYAQKRGLVLLRLLIVKGASSVCIEHLCRTCRWRLESTSSMFLAYSAPIPTIPFV